MTGHDGDTLWIESVRGPDDEPVCLITWAALQWYAPVAGVRETALDLVTCAAYAEMMMTLVTRAGVPAAAAAAFLSDVLSGRAKLYFGSRETITLLPAGSSKTGEPAVLLNRGSQRGSVTPGAARSMALQWLEVAEGTESDQMISEALRSLGPDDGSDPRREPGQVKLFGYLRELRKAAGS